MAVVFLVVMASQDVLDFVDTDTDYLLQLAYTLFPSAVIIASSFQLYAK